MTEEEIENEKETGQTEKTNLDGKKDNKNISVKGINKDLYKKVMQKAVETGKTIGEVTNDAYKALLSTMEFAVQKSGAIMHKDFEIISNFNELSVSDTDLKEIGKPVAFSNIDYLDLSNVSNEVFEKYIRSILHVKKLTIPSKMKKSIILTRAKYIEKIEQKG